MTTEDGRRSVKGRPCVGGLKHRESEVRAMIQSSSESVVGSRKDTHMACDIEVAAPQ